MIIQSRRVWITDQFAPLALEVEGDHIQAVYPYGSRKADIDYEDFRIVPGFIDIHTHGGYGFDITHPKQEGFDRWIASLPAEGVTTLLPTTLSAPMENLEEQLEFLGRQFSRPFPVHLAGIHMEGPFLSRKYKGAQPEKALTDPDIQAFEKLNACANGKISLITLAPERENALDLIRYCTDNGIATSIGHSEADYSQCILGLANGVSSFTHTYNAMSAFHHRNPGAVNAALRFKEVYSELIADGHHISDPAIYTFFAMKGASYSILVSDSLALKGMSAGSQGLLLDGKITMSEQGMIVLEDGTFAGSALRLNEAISVCERAGVPFDQIVRALSTNPAAMLGLNDRGVIQAGKKADLVILADTNQVLATWMDGRLVFDWTAQKSLRAVG